MDEVVRHTGIFENPHGIVNRITGFLLLTYFSPIILLIIGFILLHFRHMPIFVASYTDNVDTKLWQFRVTDDHGQLCRFLKQSRLHLLPQLANVARGEIDVSMALR